MAHLNHNNQKVYEGLIGERRDLTASAPRLPKTTLVRRAAREAGDTLVNIENRTSQEKNTLTHTGLKQHIRTSLSGI